MPEGEEHKETALAKIQARLRARKQLAGFTVAAYFLVLIALFAYHWIVGDDLRDVLVVGVTGLFSAFTLMVAYHFKDRDKDDGKD